MLIKRVILLIVTREVFFITLHFSPSPSPPMRFPVPSFELTAPSPRSDRTRPRARTPGQLPPARLGVRHPRLRGRHAAAPGPLSPIPELPGAAGTITQPRVFLGGPGALGAENALSVRNYSLSPHPEAAPRSSLQRPLWAYGAGRTASGPGVCRPARPSETRWGSGPQQTPSFTPVAEQSLLHMPPPPPLSPPP